MKLLNTFAPIFISGSINADTGPKTWHWILVGFVIVALAVLALPAIFKWQRRRGCKTLHLELANLGNARSRYALHAAESTGNLAFHFHVDGETLPEQAITVSKTSSIPRASATPAPAAAKKPSGAQKTLSGAAQTGGTVAGLLSTLGRLIPGSAGKSISGLGTEVRQGQQTATEMKQVSQYAGKLQPKPAGQAPSQAAPRTMAPTMVSSATIEIWAQTPFVEPGQKIHVDLRIQPANPYHTRHYPYVLKSRSIEYKEAPVITEENTILIEALNPFERFAPFMIFAGSIIVLLVLFLSLW